MKSLLRKELNAFFTSLSGYLAMGIFLLATSLFLWVIPGEFNLIESRQASLKGFFTLAPWLYLFLVPAITMRMFAEEKKSGTLELLLTRPLSSSKIIFTKYLAALILVSLSLLPTLIYFLTVYLLGNPMGNIDTGATWGSYAGLLLLASGYIAIGLFASASTSNQAISFLVAIVLSYIFFKGFNALALLNPPAVIQNVLLELSLNDHYLSLNRGVIDSRDVAYFIVLTVVFLVFIPGILRGNKLAFRFNTKISLIAVLLIAFSTFSISYRFFRIDLTAEKRYSISETSKTILSKQKGISSIEIYLSGDLPAEMKTFQRSIIDKIEDLNAYSPHRIYYRIFDVYSQKTDSVRNNTIIQLINAGIQPISLEHKTTEGLSTKQIFPGAIVRSNGKMVALNLLKNNPLLPYSENIKHSVELLEYEFARALRVLQNKKKPQVAFLKGHGEADAFSTNSLRMALSESYSITETTAKELNNDDSTRILVVADPVEPFPESDKLFIDQFIMRGGRVLWCIDPVYTAVDSLSRGHSTLAFEKGLNLRDLLFGYGVRINADLLQDVVCMEYPVNTAPPGQPTKFVPAPFYYALLATPNANNPVSRNLNRVMTEFVSSVDSVGANPGVKISPLLTTSPYSRRLQTPVEVSILSATTPPDSRLFNQGMIPIGMALEGKFASGFKNRMTHSLGIDQQKILSESKATKMIVITDGGIITNKVRNRNGKLQTQPLGYDMYSGQTFGNRDFLLNCIDYLNDNSGIMQLRSRTVKMRLLDKTKIRKWEKKIVLFNTLAPILVILISGIAYSLLRRQIYRKK
ncbi:MAG: gliding motility-associated ABC transporter substrate-binding protein GldG [Prolixibacteraceae bacterium]|nr:gliding motility-associated ABC transporter substrate-binding protein GldG [Prolixibacteraceae bacterium]